MNAHRLFRIITYKLAIYNQYKMAARALYVVGAKRTAFGAFGGKFRQLSATDLAVHSSKAAIAAANIDPKVGFDLVPMI